MMKKCLVCAAPVLLLLLSGCPLAIFATITVNNASVNGEILEIHFQTPQDVGYGPNLLEPGDRLIVGESAPFEVFPDPGSTTGSTFLVQLVVLRQEGAAFVQDNFFATFDKVKAGDARNLFWRG